MGKRLSARIEASDEKSELRCMWAGLFGILSSCQVHYKLTSNRRPTKKNVIDDSRKLHNQLASFDEQSRKIQNEANTRVNGSEKSVRSLILDDMYFDRHKNKQIKVKARQLTKTDSKIADQTQKVARKEGQRALLSSSNYANAVHHHQPSTSPHIDDEIVQQAKMSVKAFIDQMFVDGKVVRSKEWTGIDPMPFSDALQVLSTNKDFFMELLQEPIKQSQQKSNGKPATFSVTEIKQKLKHTFGDLREKPNQFSKNKRSKVRDDCNFRVKQKEKLGKKLELKSDRGSDITCFNETSRKKIDFSISRFSKKRDVDVALETKRLHMSAQLKRLNAVSTETSKRSPKTVGTTLSTTEQELLTLSPRRDSQGCSGSARTRFSTYNNSLSPNERQRTCLSPLKTNTEVISCDRYENYDDSTECLSTEINYESHHINISATDNIMRSNGKQHIVETNNIRHSDDPVIHAPPESLSENVTFTSTEDGHDLNMSENINYQEEHQSPVSVLEQFFAEDANNPSTITMLQTDRKRSQPKRFYFGEVSVSEIACNDEQDYISQFVYLMLQESCLNWDQLSRISPQAEELIHPSLFDEVEFLPSAYRFDPKLLFDHINEVLLQIHRSHFSFLPWPAIVKPTNSSVPLEEHVLGEIMRKAAKFYLLPRTQERTVDQLVANDVSDSRSWIDARTEAERIMIHISEYILEEYVFDIILGFHS